MEESLSMLEAAMALATWVVLAQIKWTVSDPLILRFPRRQVDIGGLGNVIVYCLGALRAILCCGTVNHH